MPDINTQLDYKALKALFPKADDKNLSWFYTFLQSLWNSTHSAGTGDVTAVGTLTAGQLIIGAGGTAITVGNLSGDVTTSGSTVTALSLTGVTAGTYGDASHVGQFTVDAKGRISAAANVPITGLAGVPYFIPSGETFTVPEFIQGLWAMPIVIDGTLVVDGFLVEVD